MDRRSRPGISRFRVRRFASPRNDRKKNALHRRSRRRPPRLQNFIAAEINPFVDEWEKAELFPAHELFKKLGDLGFLELNKPVEFGGQGLDYTTVAADAAAALGGTGLCPVRKYHRGSRPLIAAAFRDRSNAVRCPHREEAHLRRLEG
jgi:alkylation response protein AidB-like acyl-CoA dehydrogenase